MDGLVGLRSAVQLLSFHAVQAQRCPPSSHSASGKPGAVHSAEQARKAWREGFDRNCLAPCQLAPQDIERFLAAVPALRKGDSFTLLFTARGAEVAANSRRVGSITDPEFARQMLATFIGLQPPTPRLKRELLGNHE